MCMGLYWLHTHITVRARVGFLRQRLFGKCWLQERERKKEKRRGGGMIKNLNLPGHPQIKKNLLDAREDK